MLPGLRHGARSVPRYRWAVPPAARRGPCWNSSSRSYVMCRTAPGPQPDRFVTLRTVDQDYAAGAEDTERRRITPPPFCLTARLASSGVPYVTAVSAPGAV